MSSKRKKTTTTKKPSLKKKKKEEAAAIVLPPTTPNPSLPDDLLLSCFARVSRLYYPTLSLVSKSFRSLIASPELYKTRSSIGHTESSLYVCLKFRPDPIPRWFTLCRKPDQTLTTNDDDVTKLKKKKKKKPIGYALAKIQEPYSGNPHSSRLYARCNGLSYEPSEGRWERLSWEMDYGWVWYSKCVIGDVLYMFNEGVFKWYDGKAGLWRVLKGVKGLPKIPRYVARLADYGGKMLVLWERVVAYKDKVILCAVIALERRDDEEIWGKVEWYDTVLTVPNKSCRVEHALGVTF